MYGEKYLLSSKRNDVQQGSHSFSNYPLGFKRWSYVVFSQLRQHDICKPTYTHTLFLCFLKTHFLKTSVLTLLIAFTRSSLSKWKAIKMWRQQEIEGAVEAWPVSGGTSGIFGFLDHIPFLKTVHHRTRSMHALQSVLNGIPF